jgi:hypothetical protein
LAVFESSRSCNGLRFAAAAAVVVVDRFLSFKS